MSKLAYEEELVSTAKTEKEQEQNKKSGKKSKKATMSLEEFNSTVSKNRIPHSVGTNATSVAALIDPVDNKLKGIIQKYVRMCVILIFSHSFFYLNIGIRKRVC